MSYQAPLALRLSTTFADLFVSERGSPLGGQRGVLISRKEVSYLLIKSARKSGKIAAAGKTGRVRLVTSRSAEPGEVANRAKDHNEYRLHIVMDKESFLRLRGLKAQLEASTEAEVIRRALKAYEIFEPADDIPDQSGGPNSADVTTGNNVEHLYVPIPHRTKVRLDIEREVSGRTYSDQVRHALRVLAQLTKEVDTYREAFVKQALSLQKGESYASRVLKLAAAL